MGLHKKFPKSPFEVVNPDYRWVPSIQDGEIDEVSYQLPPLVDNLRRKVNAWRKEGYRNVSQTSQSLLNYWFNTEHSVQQGETLNEFQYYFAQREAVETVIYLHEIGKVKKTSDLLHYDTQRSIAKSMINENWTRFVIKMATGTGKTKVLSLLVAWSFFHKTYESDSEMSRNFLLIAPNIIVLDRLKSDFEGLFIFSHDPVIPPNGHQGRNWKDDFKISVHLQDEVNIFQKFGNIFLTNIHRVFENTDSNPSIQDENTMNYFLGKNAVSLTHKSMTDLGEIVRNVNELMVLNDEAHHIHDRKLVWFQSIQDIHNKLVQKGKSLSIQIDVTATPKNQKGGIFPQVISDYALVEAIFQNIVKHPVVPDANSRKKLREVASSKYHERYEEYIHLGYKEWEKTYRENKKLGKKSVLFVMTDDTKNCDEVAKYLENTYPALENSVLVIHTNKSGMIQESVSKKKLDELEKLRKIAKEIDTNHYKAIVSVLMLKEGWDVRNVTTIVGLRPFNSKSKVLPEQTLGRGLRRMFPKIPESEEYVSIIGTNAFMDFVDSVKSEGVTLQRAEMGELSKALAPLVIEIDHENKKKNIKELDIKFPILQPKLYREYNSLSKLDVSTFKHTKLELKNLKNKSFKEIDFKLLIYKDDKEDHHHRTLLDSIVINDYRSTIGYFANKIYHDLRLNSTTGYQILYPKIEEFVKKFLFKTEVDLASESTLRNLSEIEAIELILETFKLEINRILTTEEENIALTNYINLSECKPFLVKQQEYFIPTKSIFNKIVGDSSLEIRFARFLETCQDIISYTKNFLYSSVSFKIDYINQKGGISNYYPDFIVKFTETHIVIVETKGLEALDVPSKMKRLKEWCKDVNDSQDEMTFSFVFVGQDQFNEHTPPTFLDLIRRFTKYQ